MRLRRPRIVAAGLLAALTFSAAALADNFYVRDGQGQLFQMASKVLNNVSYPIYMIYGSPGGIPTQAAMDASGNLGVNIIGAGAPSYSASGATAVTGSLSATGQSAAFSPTNYGRPANIAFSGTGSFGIQLERKFVGDATWYPLAAPAGQRYAWSTNGTQTVTVSDAFTETESGTTLRWDVTSCSGCSLTYRISQ